MLLWLLFLGRKEKREQSRDGEDYKKVKEHSDSLSLLSDEVFADRLNSPEIAKLFLLSTLRNIDRDSSKGISHQKLVIF